MLVVAGFATAWWLLAPGASNGASAATVQAGVGGAASATSDPAAGSPQSGPVSEYQAMSGKDPNDLASYFKPGDPEPTGAELIEALQHAGVRTGIGAFNPPGTSPPLAGLAVPDDFRLPLGYARHHQVTDQGVPIEPILVFSPGFILRDAQGRPIAMPANGVVPPELAPPGLPLRPVVIPSP
ncbi:hypothetical protein DT603_09490 [Pseudoxanthomonas gei]|uniref:Uncharacterized protein n=1 Tax=Pseudoxanthomonas gei TaxID=1383030 RepID=A0ABX0AC21_9GAMM|nr:hypothetical protein [Pseudoxanthomonas gei]